MADISAFNVNGTDYNFKDAVAREMASNVSEVKTSTTNATSDSIKFGIDANGKYGYIKQGEATVTPFRNPTGDAQPNQVMSGKKFSTADLEDAVGTLENFTNTQALFDSGSKNWGLDSTTTPTNPYLFFEFDAAGGQGSKPVRLDTNKELHVSATDTELNAKGLYTQAQFDAAGGSGIICGGIWNNYYYVDGEHVSGQSATKTKTLPAGTYTYLVSWAPGANQTGAAVIKVGTTEIARADNNNKLSRDFDRVLYTGTYTLATASAVTCEVSAYLGYAIAVIAKI